MNLISNAVKYTPDGGSIQVSIREKPTGSPNYGEYEFVFQDNGVGMSEEFQKILFEPFTRAEDSRLAKAPGTGLGMTITRNIIRMMDGDIQVYSKLNEGTRFVVNMHLKYLDGASTLMDDLIGKSVLVVDDDPIACEGACVIIKELGMQGDSCLSGQEAVARVLEQHKAENDYFAILLDWKMPDMDGVQTARALRQAVGPDVTIIFLTAYDWSEIEAEARLAGVDHFLAKPLFKSRLMSSFRALFEPEKDTASGVPVLSESLTLEGKRILLAEDNDINAEIVLELLKSTGVQVDWARDGREAVDTVDHARPGYYDLILMDIQMPHLDGYQATRAIREMDRKDTKRIPIIAMTANAFTEDVRRSLQAGMNEHISKPVDLAQLEQVLKKYLL